MTGPRLRLPHVGFNRKVGAVRQHATSPRDGRDRGRGGLGAAPGPWLPTAADKAYVESLMRPVYEPGKIAAWLAPPRNGINGQPLDYESRPLLTLCPLRPHPRLASLVITDFGAVGCTAKS